MNNYLITGANAFLGKSFVEYLSSDETNSLLITSRSVQDFHLIESPRLHYVPGVDLLSAADLMHLFNEAASFFQGKFHIINCTGYYEGQQLFLDTPIEEAKKIMDSNYTAAYNVTHALMPLMIQNGGGHIAAFTCNSVRYNYPQMAPFTAAKSALESFIRSLANELYVHGIYANSFQLSTLLTEHEVQVKPNGDHENWLKTNEVVRFVEHFISSPVQIHNGNTLQLFRYSKSFFDDSYNNRISK